MLSRQNNSRRNWSRWNGSRQNRSRQTMMLPWQGRLLGLYAGDCQMIVVTIGCSLMSGHGQSHKFAY